eukprot:TRINITY_DN19152_c0_g2_i1.p1 TRINITY_DN19152_c0_g2~~TRINITY_DN19152_c0_g2_i1.p1  ORF type:complete len:182 (-),score=31.21 TRINITY_DN19152_c0_g2_i1:184-729(-)
MMNQKQAPLRSLKPPTGLCTTRRKSLPRTSANKGITCFINRKQKNNSPVRSSSQVKSRYNTHNTDEPKSVKPYLRSGSTANLNRKSGINFYRTSKVETQRMSQPNVGKCINLNEATKQVLRTSVLIENKSCENINVGIRIRPFTKQETAARITKEAWSKSSEGKLIDKKKGLIYGFGSSWG